MDESKSGYLDCARDVLDIEIQGLNAVKAQLDERFSRALALFASCTGRVVITGLGKSGLVGRKIAATLSSTGTPSFFLHPVEGAHGDLGMIRKEDVVLAISNSGETDELNAILPALKVQGVHIVGITRDPGSSLGKISDIVLTVKVPREACPMGLAPTASTTACLALGDALAVCLMNMKDFGQDDFHRFHPGGSLGRRLASKVESLMGADIPKVGDDSDFALALEVLNDGGLGLVAIVDDAQKLMGVLSDGDVRRMVCSGAIDGKSPVKDVMSVNPKHAEVGQFTADALNMMEKSQITVLPVVDENGILKGIVHLHDLLGKGSVNFRTLAGVGEG